MFNELFNTLDKWRHFPNYQLERRADIFFALYLPLILKTKGIKDIKCVIPEFPIRIGEINDDVDINKSYKIDYLVIHGNNQVKFVELKTDDSSRRNSQDKYLKESKKKGFKTLLHGLIKIFKATKYKKKYRFLVDELVEAGALEKFNNTYTVSSTDYIDEEIIYIQPNNSDNKPDVIDFKRIANKLRELADDGVAQRFSKSLIKWADDQI